MDDLFNSLNSMKQHKNTLQYAIDEVQQLINITLQTKQAISINPGNLSSILDEYERATKQGLELLYNKVPKKHNCLKGMHSALANYEKIIKSRFKDNTLPTDSYGSVASQSHLISRAIVMHLIREGRFDVARTLISDYASKPTHVCPTSSSESQKLLSCGFYRTSTYYPPTKSFDISTQELAPVSLQNDFLKLHQILEDMRERHDLTSAIDWARGNNASLERRGSDLEFRLCRLRFLCLYLNVDGGPIPNSSVNNFSQPLLRAWAYARDELSSPNFVSRYGREVQQLIASLAYWKNNSRSPYKHLLDIDSAWEEVSTLFKREFCILLGLSADSPLFVAINAGALALPVLLKFQKVLKEGKAEWTSSSELPVEIPLPSSFHFHPVFVCPVSKEQTTDTNPPMMLPCGHVIAKEPLDRISAGAKFKCPYCPEESHPRDARRVFL